MAAVCRLPISTPNGSSLTTQCQFLSVVDVKSSLSCVCDFSRCRGSTCDSWWLKASNGDNLSSHAKLCLLHWKAAPRRKNAVRSLRANPHAVLDQPESHHSEELNLQDAYAAAIDAVARACQLCMEVRPVQLQISFSTSVRH